MTGPSAVDVPDTSCHWYITAPDNTFGEGFSWAMPLGSRAEGLRDVGELHNTVQSYKNHESLSCFCLGCEISLLLGGAFALMWSNIRDINRVMDQPKPRHLSTRTW